MAVSGKDVRNQDLVGRWCGPTSYTLTGRTVDRYGKGIAQATATLNDKRVTTSADGNFQFTVSTYKQTENFIIRISKDGCIFIPDSVVVALSRIEDAKSGDPVTFPDFIGIDTTNPSDSYPLRAGTSWTYSRTVDNDPPVEQTVRVSGTVTAAGYGYYRLSPPLLAGYMDFRVDKNSVYTVKNGADAEFLRFGVPPERKWIIGDTSANYVTTGKLAGVETATVPAGKYEYCLKYEIATPYGATSYESCTLWLAKGIGVVKSVKTLVNYGETRETVTDELKAYTP